MKVAWMVGERVAQRALWKAVMKVAKDTRRVAWMVERKAVKKVVYWVA